MKKFLIPLTFALLAVSYLIWMNSENEMVQEVTKITEKKEAKTTPTKHVNVVKEDKVLTSRNPEVQTRTAKETQTSQMSASGKEKLKPRVLRAKEILDEVTIRVLESKLTQSESTKGQATRVSLIETNMKHPLMVVKESGVSLSQGEEKIDTIEAQVASHFILQIKPNVSQSLFESKLASMNLSIKEKLSDTSFIVSINDPATIDEIETKKQSLESLNDFVAAVEPDYFVYAIESTNDPRLLELWGLHNTGQTGGSTDKDIDAKEAWDLQTGSKNVLVGVIDTGIDRNHEDLRENMWVNPNEIAGNGVDDDQNGYVDDLHGWDFYNNDNNPDDDNAHGTHCAGTIGAVGNNGKGVVGVNWNVSMVGLKFLGGSGGGYLSDAVKAISYATKIGVDLTSNSWGGGGFSSSMKNAIDEAANAGIGFVAAAGNHAGDNDAYPSYPASYESVNVISVGANDHFGKSAYFSCYGKTSVDLFAPGVNILSTIPGNSYASYSGTSMATPHVAGAYALLLAANPQWQSAQVKDALLESTDPEDTLAEKCVTGGRLNVLKALSNEPPKENLISANPSSIEFGEMGKSETQKIEFILSNSGNANTTVTEVSLLSEDSSEVPFEVSLPTPFVLEPNMAQVGSVSFSADIDGIFEATLRVTSDASNEPNLSIPLSAQVISQPQIVVDPTEMHFGLNENESQTQILTIQNLGDGDLVYSLTRDQQSAWLVCDEVHGHVLPAGQKTEIEVQANANQMPTSFEQTGLQLESNDPNAPSVSIDISAEKLSENGGLVFRPENLDFGNVYVGHSVEKNIEAYNSGTNPISISRIAFSDSSFSHHLVLPITLQPGEKTSAKLYFTPLAKGNMAANMMVLTDENGFSMRSFPVSGNAVLAPLLSYNPGDFSASVKMNEEKSLQIHLQNQGGSTLSWSLKGANGLAGSSFSLGNLFAANHFAPLAKGVVDLREGAPVSTLGGGPDYHGYSWNDSNDHAGPVHVWKDISSSGQLLEELSSTDDGQAKIATPFPLSFYDQSFNEIFVSSNGYLTLGHGSSLHGHFPLPTTMMPGNLIAAFATDLDPSQGGNIYYLADENSLTVQYDKVRDFAGQGEYTFQINVNAGGVIRFHYENMNGPVDRATTGIQNSSADVGLLIGYNNQQLQSNSTIRVSTAPKWLHISKLQGTIEGGQSEILDLTVKAGSIRAGSYQAELEITTNDPAQKEVTIPVTLTIEEAKSLALTPLNIDFGPLEVGLSAHRSIQIENNGNAPVTLENMNISGESFTSNFQGVILQPGQMTEVKVTFQPSQGGLFANTASLVSDAQNSPNEVQLKGEGLATPKLHVIPEVLNVTLAAGSSTIEKVALENFAGLADGSFSVKAIRSEAQSSQAKSFNEQNNESGEIIPEDPFANEHAPDQLIVGFKTGKSNFENANGLGEAFTIERSLGSAIKPGSASKALSSSNLILIKAKEGLSLPELASQLTSDPAVAYAEPNYLVRRTELPNDPQFSDQWALEKIQATQAWDLAKGSYDVKVGVIDTGIDYNHPDLQGNIWKNPGETPANGIDDDGNGYVDDVYGWDFVNSDNDPMDGHNHGTHVAGTIAATTDNGTQVAGVAWHTKLVALKFLADGGWGYTSDAIDAIAYCAAMDIPISNNSWGGGGYSQALKDVINEAGNAGHLFCAAAGNSGTDNDQSPHYPANYDSPNVISVAASDANDQLAYFSCYGEISVDLAAPGTSILNLIPNGGTAYMSGTSMATPHVAGAAAVLLGQNPTAQHQELKNLLMNSTDKVQGFEGKMVTAGRLNLLNAIQSSSPNWLSVSPNSGIVPAGEKFDLDFSINAANFVAGQKSAIVTLETNDPLAKLLEVPVNLTITGTPEIALNPDLLNFGDVWTETSKVMKLTISNLGTDNLVIEGLDFGHDAFTTSSNSLSLAPGEEQLVEVEGRPVASENINSFLKVNSNDPANPVSDVQLLMNAISPPSLSYAPSSIQVNLEPNQKSSDQITIYNSGEATGKWEARIVETNVKRARNFDFAQMVAGLNEEGRAPDFSNPGHALFLNPNPTTQEEDAPNAVRYEGSNTASGLEIAVLGGEASTELESFGLGLSQMENISGVTTIDVSGLTPLLEEISSFDAVIVYSNYPYWDNEALGNLVYDYSATGGAVITMPGENLLYAESKDWSLGGNWRAQGMSLFEMQPSLDRFENHLGEIQLPNHPLLEGVESFSGNLRILHQEPTQGGVVAASWADGAPLVTFRTEPNIVVDLNFFPTHEQWDQTTDGWVLIANALNWSTRSFQPAWLSGAPLSGEVSGGTENQMELNVDATGLAEGNYTAEVHFSSNDPKQSFYAVEVTLEVLENQAPVASSKTLMVQEDGQIEFVLEGTDPDGDELTFIVTEFPNFGSLNNQSENFVYAPARNFNGQDRLVYKVSDGRKESELAIISFEVEPQNDAPWAQSFDVNATEDQFFSVDFVYGDIDGDQLSLEFSKLPTNGFLWEENGNWLYFPNNHFNGNDSIRYIVTDGELQSEEAVVLIQLAATNDAPVAQNLSFETKEDTALFFQLEASDVDGDNLTYEIVSDPQHGLLTQKESNQWVYSPFDQFSGSDTFTYRPFDGSVHGNIGLVNLKIIQVNDAPIVQSSTFNLKEDGSISIKLIASDPDGDDLSFSITSEPTNGVIVGNGPNYTYTPYADFNGGDAFSVVATDGSLSSDPAIISLVVESQNDAPSLEYNLSALSGGVRETPLRIQFTTGDVDEDPVTVSLGAQPANGDCYLEDGELVFLPAPGFEGSDKIELVLSDGTQTIKEELSVMIHAHHDPLKISFDQNTDPLLVNMLYQVNEILLQEMKAVFQLENNQSENSVIASMGSEASADAIALSEWLENVESLSGSSFVFHPEEIENRLTWKVSSFLDPASSVDTDDGSNADNSSTEDSAEESESKEDLTEGGNTDEVFNEPSIEKLAIIEALGSNWYNAQGIGLFFDGGNGWIYHIEMGWCFLKICDDQTSFWMFHEKLGWFWMNQQMPNMLYLSSESTQGWYYFPQSTLAESKYIYGYENSTWYQWNQ